MCSRLWADMLRELDVDLITKDSYSLTREHKLALRAGQGRMS